MGIVLSLREGSREASGMYQKERFGPRAFGGLWDSLEQEESSLYPVLFIRLCFTYDFPYQPQYPHLAALRQLASDGFSRPVTDVQ